MMARRLTVALALALLLAGCVSPPPRSPSAPGPSKGPAGTSWIVTGILDRQAVTSPIPGTELTVEFGTDGTVRGSAGCNGYAGPYTVTDGAISVGPLAHQEMGCVSPEGIMEQEAAFFAAFESASTIERQPALLILRTPEGGTALILTVKS
ncbi:MAG: META domain-containing protein [Propioniciclava sp.]|uniref:META domain-containing protein n=1 Tax=Propioniciclava sp. TaxID=2038686 RepID=UPI0039E2C350